MTGLKLPATPLPQALSWIVQHLEPTFGPMLVTRMDSGHVKTRPDPRARHQLKGVVELDGSEVAALRRMEADRLQVYSAVHPKTGEPIEVVLTEDTSVQSPDRDGGTTNVSFVFSVLPT